MIYMCVCARAFQITHSTVSKLKCAQNVLQLSFSPSLECEVKRINEETISDLRLNETRTPKIPVKDPILHAENRIDGKNKAKNP